MIAMSGLRHSFAALLLLLGCLVPVAATAQSIDYDAPLGGSEVSGGDDAGAGEDAVSASPSGGKRAAGGKHVEVAPYIEVAQLFTKEFSSGDDVLTYTRVAAGVDASLAGQNNAASVSLRYEHHFGWNKRSEDADVVSGIAQAYTTVAPGLRIEAGGLATRTRVEGDGAAVLAPTGDGDDVTQLYSAYVGPSLATHVGVVALDANYRFGYTKVDSPDSVVVAPGATATDVFDESTAHSASIHAGVKPHEVLPVGLAAGAGYYREDISNLDQRIEDFSARIDVTYELSYSLALVGGVGYEDVQISSRDAVRDEDGNPVIGSDGRYVTDKSAPRLLAYDTDGFIWDAGVMWRPSRRTALEAHVGRRYDSTSYYGSFAYQPTPRSAINISVYDTVAGFGGQVNRALADLPTDFEAVRNPLTGDLGGCVASLEEGSCLSGVLGSVRSSTFRARGIMGSYALTLGRYRTGIGAGYDRRKFIAAPGSVLAVANGVVDENYWLSAFFSGRLDERSGFTTNGYANWFRTADGFGGDATALGVSASYFRDFTSHLVGSAALGLDGLNRDASLDDIWSLSAVVGLRYNF